MSYCYPFYGRGSDEPQAQRSGETASHLAHNQKTAGSTPAPATIALIISAPFVLRRATWAETLRIMCVPSVCRCNSCNVQYLLIGIVVGRKEKASLTGRFFFGSITMKPSPPCKDCKTRELGCHEICSAYKLFRIDLINYNKAVKQLKHNDHSANDALWLPYNKHHKSTQR